jgi:CubicO group peptidase (beta-lactamase class C family)
MLDRRRLLVGATALAGYSALARAAVPYEWQTISPADAGFVPGFGERLDQFVLGGQAPNIHGVIIVRRGRVVFENYFDGDDQVRDEYGRAHFERVAFSAERSHELRSVSKSIVGLLYGIALQEGKVPPLDAPLLAQFPDYTDLPDLEQRRRWTIRHAITMTLGLEWNEDVSYEDPRNGQTAMDRAADPYRHVLGLPIVAAAGARWIYCGGATALIGKILENGTKQKLPDYARAALFDPLGIGPTVWRIGPNGERNFASGIGMRPRDLARIGQMVLERGKAGERQIVPADWLEESFKPQVTIRDRREYGCHWYLGEMVFNSADGPRQERWIAAVGNGGQRLYVFPRLDLQVVITAGNYNRRDQGVPPNRVLTERILPSLHLNPN